METAAHYDKLILEGNDPFRDPPSLREYMDKWDGAEFLARLELAPDKNVLEIGIGTGRLAARVAPHCGRLTGIDISKKTVERASENLAGYDNVKLICGDFSDYDLADSYDVIYSSLTLMHFEDKKRFMEKTASLLRPGGVFCLSIDKNQSEFIDMGTRRLRVYPDSPENTLLLIKEASLQLTGTFETEFAHIIVCRKN